MRARLARLLDALTGVDRARAEVEWRAAVLMLLLEIKQAVEKQA